MDKIMFGWQMNVDRVRNENAFGILKNKWKILHYINACVDWAPKIVVACCFFHKFWKNTLAIKGLPIDLFYGIRGQMMFIREGWIALQRG